MNITGTQKYSKNRMAGEASLGRLAVAHEDVG